MDARRSILPPASTSLERVIDTTLPRDWGAMADAAEPASTAQHPALLPWLAQQWQLGQFERYFSDPRELLAKGLPWLRERGSAAAVRRALAWQGYLSVTLEEDGARLHINPGREVSNADIARMAHVVRASIPLHVHFYRVFYRFDLRALRWDRAPKLDGALWENDSGTPVDVGEGEPPVIGSQGRINQSQAQRPNLTPLRSADHQHTSGRMRRADQLRLDVWRWDGRMQRLPAGGQLQHTPGQTAPHVPHQPLSAYGEAWASSADARPSQSPGATSHWTAGAARPRVAPARGWTGRWDGDRWQQSNIHGKTTESTE